MLLEFEPSLEYLQQLNAEHEKHQTLFLSVCVGAESEDHSEEICWTQPRTHALVNHGQYFFPNKCKTVLLWNVKTHDNENWKHTGVFLLCIFSSLWSFLYCFIAFSWARYWWLNLVVVDHSLNLRKQADGDDSVSDGLSVCLKCL